MPKTFDRLTCFYKSDGTRAGYDISADSGTGPSFDRIQLVIFKEGGNVVWGAEPQ